MSVRAERDGVPITHEYAHALWGVEANYPGKRKNKYLDEVANELLRECGDEVNEALVKRAA